MLAKKNYIVGEVNQTLRESSNTQNINFEKLKMR